MSQTIDVKVPDIGDFSEVEIIEVLVAPGDHVHEDDPLISLESDKASMEVPATQTGTIKEIKVAVGDRVSEGSLILVLEAADAQSPVAPPSPEGVQEADAEPPQPKPDQDLDAPRAGPAAAGPAADMPRANGAGALARVNESGFAKAHAGPSVRAFARDLGADLTKIRGTGPKGRILREDVLGFVKGVLSKVSELPEGTGIPPIPEVDFSQFGEIEEVDLPRIKKLSGPFLHRAWLNIPHVTHNDEADITALDPFRKELDTKAKAEGYRVTLLAFIMKAVTAALIEFPDLNASLSGDGTKLILKKYFHIGIAVDTPGGLVVPVVRNVDQKGIVALSKELGEVSARARDGKLGLKEMQGGCFSISSLGGLGGTGFTPIINAPEVAILGVSRAKMKPQWSGEAFEPKLMLPLSLSYDHRVVDGAAAARFTTHLCGLLADARRILL